MTHAKTEVGDWGPQPRYKFPWHLPNAHGAVWGWLWVGKHELMDVEATAGQPGSTTPTPETWSTQRHLQLLTAKQNLHISLQFPLLNSFTVWLIGRGQWRCGRALHPFSLYAKDWTEAPELGVLGCFTEAMLPTSPAPIKWLLSLLSMHKCSGSPLLPQAGHILWFLLIL